MGGRAKREYNHEDILLQKSFKRPLNKIYEILPKSYSKKVILSYYKEFYPFQWQIFTERQETYEEKGSFLTKKGKRKRYYPKTPEDYFYSLPKVKNMLSKGKRKQHSENYNKEEINKKRDLFERKRKNSNKKINIKIEEAKLNAQNVNPSYLNFYIDSYHKRGITTEEKLIIVKELEKFDTPEVTRFFRKLNDAEQNNMIKYFSFKHLQDYGHYVKLRKKFKGKKKPYQIEKATLQNKRPEDLYKNLKRNAIQSKQTYNYFISHSSKDKSLVRNTIKQLNERGKNCYCDWTLDDNFLKREFVNEYTREVLKIRMEQSDKLIFIRTNNSIGSDWVKFELDYYANLDKPIEVINYTGND